MTGEEKVLERYLNAATRGLWGRSKREAREELECHLLERTRRLQVEGLPRAEAVEKACGRMGSAGRVALGFMEVHSMSKLGLSTIAVALAVPLAFGGYLTWSYATYTNQNQGCGSSVSYNSGPMMHFCLSQGSTLKVLDVVKQLEQLGFPVERKKGQNAGSFALVSLPKGSSGKALLWNVTDHPEGSKWGGVDVLGLAQEFARKVNVPVRLEGWEKPVLWIGNRKLALSSELPSETAYNVYAAQAFYQMMSTPIRPKTDAQLARVGNLIESASGLVQRTLKVGTLEGQVLAVLSKSERGNLVLDVQPVKGRQVTVFTQAGPLEITRNWTAFNSGSTPKLLAFVVDPHVSGRDVLNGPLEGIAVSL